MFASAPDFLPRSEDLGHRLWDEGAVGSEPEEKNAVELLQFVFPTSRDITRR